MTLGDLESMAALLGDPDVMTYYPELKTRTKRGPGSSGISETTPSTGSDSGSSETRDGEFVRAAV